MIILAALAGLIVSTAMVVIVRYALAVESDLRAVGMLSPRGILRGPARARR